MNQLIGDLLQGVSAQDVPLLLIQIFSAVGMSLMAAFFLSKKASHDASAGEVVLISSSVSFLVLISRYLLPLAVVAAAALLVLVLLKRETSSKYTALLYFLVLTLSVGCGSGYVALTGLYFLVGVIPSILLLKK